MCDSRVSLIKNFTRFDFSPKFIFELELLIDGSSPERESQKSRTRAAGVDDDRVVTSWPHYRKIQTYFVNFNLYYYDIYNTFTRSLFKSQKVPLTKQQP